MELLWHLASYRFLLPVASAEGSVEFWRERAREFGLDVADPSEGEPETAGDVRSPDE